MFISSPRRPHPRAAERNGSTGARNRNIHLHRRLCIENAKIDPSPCRDCDALLVVRGLVEFCADIIEELAAAASCDARLVSIVSEAFDDLSTMTMSCTSGSASRGYSKSEENVRKQTDARKYVC
jgi:hypothetical protein